MPKHGKAVKKIFRRSLSFIIEVKACLLLAWDIFCNPYAEPSLLRAEINDIRGIVPSHYQNANINLLKISIFKFINT